jgi:hypothetical protein
LKINFTAAATIQLPYIDVQTAWIKWTGCTSPSTLMATSISKIYLKKTNLRIHLFNNYSYIFQ